MTEDKKTVTLLWVDHCYEPTEGMYSLWFVLGRCFSHLGAREKGFCLLGPTKDVAAGQQLVMNLNKAFDQLGMTVNNSETADD